MHRTDDLHCFRSDPLIRWQAIAAALESNPAAWDWAPDNISSWLSQGRVHPAALLVWRRWLLEGSRDQTKSVALLAVLPDALHTDELHELRPGDPRRISRITCRPSADRWQMLDKLSAARLSALSQGSSSHLRMRRHRVGHPRRWYGSHRVRKLRGIGIRRNPRTRAHRLES